MKRSPSGSLIDVIEAIYDEPRASWLPTVLASVQRLVPESLSGVAYVYDISSADPAAWQTSYPVVTDGAPRMLAEEIDQSFKLAPPDFRRMLFAQMKPAATYSETMGHLLTDQHERGAEAAERLASFDAIYVNAVDPDGRGVLLSFNLAAQKRLAPLQRRRFAMLAAHISAARRLLVSPREPAAIFHPSGKVAHIERVHERGITSLGEHVRRHEGLRASRTDPDEVLAAWCALVQGKYTLVGRVEADGRRYVVAYENPPGVYDPRGLTRTEAAVVGWTIRGHSQKLIAYELGVSLGTVGGLLARVYRKLRVRSRIELLERLVPPENLTCVQQDDRKIMVFSGVRARVSPDALASLTSAEQHVVRALLEGKTSQEIAASLGKSKHTVTHQIGSVFRRLGVRSRAELGVALKQHDSGALTQLDRF